MDQASPVTRCPRCGARIDAPLAEGLCVACLMAAGAGPGSTVSGANPTELQPSRLVVGQIFGRYRVEHLIGRGGMGEVYAVEQIDSGRRLALKVLSERFGDAQ